MNKKVIFIAVGVVLLLVYGIAQFKEQAEKKAAAKAYEESKWVTGTDGTVYKTYQDACRAKDFEGANVFVERLLQEAQDGGDFSDSWDEYHNAQDYVFDKEVRFLVAEGSEDASNRIIYLLTEIPVEGKKYAEGVYDMWYGIGTEYKKYKEWLPRYNQKCDAVLEIAILQKNKDLARKVLGMYKQNVNNIDQVKAYKVSKKFKYDKKNEGCSTAYHYVWYTNEDIEAAKKKYEQAVKDGAFK